MRSVVVVDLAGPRSISSPIGARAPRFAPWLEVAVRVRLVVEPWAYRECAWVHWAVPVQQGTLRLDGARPFDEGRRAASVGEPPPDLREADFAVTPDEASRVTRSLVGAWRPTLHRHAELNLVSLPDEGREAFCARCLALLAPAVRRGGPTVSARIARLAQDIETLRLGREGLELLAARARIGWYPAGIEPGETANREMVSVRSRRAR